MCAHSKSKKTEVAISKANTPKETLLKGIEYLGGISTFINEGDHVFIKFNLNLPGGFPVNTNFDVLKILIVLCKKARAEKIFLGSFPIRGVPIKVISDFLNLKDYFGTFGAELAFLDNSDIFENKDIDKDKLKKIKYESLTKVEINENEWFVPSIIMDSNKFISVNQINVNPLFKLNLSLLNIYSIIPPQYRVIETQEKASMSQDQYKKDLISSILNVYAIKRPHLSINDLFYILEGAGPFIYKDSKMKKTNLMIIGDNAITVDMVTLNALNIEVNSSELLLNAKKRNINLPKLSDIKIIGEKVEDIHTNIKECVSDLKNIQIRNFSINSGTICAGCFKQSYYLLNFMKTYMEKDLKYNVNNSFLIGKNPPEPNRMKNYFLFGDCVINTTKNYKFRTRIIESKKNLTIGAKNKILKDTKSKKKTKIKKKKSKNILELPGCPPNISQCLDLILKYFGKQSVPNLNLLTNINKIWMSGDIIDKLKLWEVL
jgi:uncharacterized protein (DUF362 family)